MEVDHGHADDRFIDLVVPLVVLIHHLFEEERLPLEFLVEVGHKDIAVLSWQKILWRDCVGLQ